MAVDMKIISEAVINGNIDDITELTQKALDDGATPDDIMNQALIVGMETVGERWKCDEMFMPEVLRSAQAMSTAMDLIRDDLTAGEGNRAGTMVIGTVKGDLHDIGKDLAGMMFEGAGYKVINLGIDQPTETFIEACKEHKPDLLGISALLTTTMPRMAEIVNGLKEAGVRDEVAVIIGGAPVTEEFAESIGADLYAPNARAGVDRARTFFQKASD
ncbi:MAG: B12-binding domain-containing protein [Candidatus Hydrogenedentota bacterium]